MNTSAQPAPAGIPDGNVPFLSRPPSASASKTSAIPASASKTSAISQVPTQASDGILRNSPLAFPLYTYIRSDSAQFDDSFRALLPPVNKRERYVFLPSKAPDSFEGRKVWKNYLSRIGDQKNCGSCYAFASTSALADQYNIQTLGKVHLTLSASRLIMCELQSQEHALLFSSQEVSKIISKVLSLYGCKGNTLMEAWRTLYVIGTTRESCFPNNQIFTDKSCVDITGESFDECLDHSPAQFFRAFHVYAVPGYEYEIRKQIYKFGPVSAAMAIYEDFYQFNPQTTIYKWNGTAKRLLGHAVVLDGWGEEDGVKFWWVRNSWGDQWGDRGYFRIVRGENHCQIEENVLVGIPDLLFSPENPPYIESLVDFKRTLYQDYHTKERKNREVVTSPYSPSGGIDYTRGYSRRLLSRQRYQNLPPLPDAHGRDWNTFIAGLIAPTPEEEQVKEKVPRKEPKTAILLWVIGSLLFIILFVMVLIG